MDDSFAPTTNLLAIAMAVCSSILKFLSISETRWLEVLVISEPTLPAAAPAPSVPAFCVPPRVPVPPMAVLLLASGEGSVRPWCSAGGGTPLLKCICPKPKSTTITR